MNRIFLNVILCLLFSSCVNYVTAKELKFEKLELAETMQEIQKGLMDRKSLCDDCGMLFILPVTAQLPFWMKNTYIPLDIIFISENGRIITIHHNAEPLNEMKKYWPQKPAKYVLEVNAGYTIKHKLKEKQILNMQNLIKQGLE